MLLSESPSKVSPSVTATPPPAPRPADPLPPPPPPLGQLLLGTDKRNPVFAVYADATDERLIVFYGFEILEVVRNDPHAPAYKLLLGRLYNSGVKLKALCESFQAAPKTIRRWGAALRQGDPAALLRVLEGRTAKRKRTLAVERFAHLRWPELVAGRTYGAVGRLQQEIKRVFGISISRSGLQSLISELKAERTPLSLPQTTSEPAPVAEIPTAVSAPTPPGADLQNGETAGHCAAATVVDPGASLNLTTPRQDPIPVAPPTNTVHRSAFFPKALAPANSWCDHAGVLLFASALAAVPTVAAPPQPILAQWLAALLLGAHNIEQTKFLNDADLEFILGRVVRFPTPQRELLKLLAEDAAVLAGLWRFNLKNLGPAVGSDFYFDPHSKHYTGEQPVLKGWCANLHSATKVMHSDFIHTARGEPIYCETTDNFEDLRQRFFGVVARARSAFQWPRDQGLTFVLDRGVYGAEFFEQVIAQPDLHVITWQKGYVAEPWAPAQAQGTTRITRYRNHSTDLRAYQFEYIARAWEPNPKLRQIVVRATNYQGRTIQVAILTDDLERNAAEIIRLIFQRWLQENDFKYLDQHYGLNEITSYRSLAYAELKGQVTDREVKSAVRQALELSQKQETDQLKRHLLAEEQACQAHERRAQKHQQLVEQLTQAGPQDTPQPQALNRQQAALQAADQRYQNGQTKRREAMAQSHKRRAAIQAQITATAATESRLEAMITAQMVRMDSSCKRLLDVLRITARNLFYQALTPFKQAYDNYRDDHAHFRTLTQSPGVLEVSAEQIVIHLLPRTHYGGRLRKAVLQTLTALNAQGLVHPCWPGKRLKFRLGQRAELEVKMNVPTD